MTSDSPHGWDCGQVSDRRQFPGALQVYDQWMNVKRDSKLPFAIYGTDTSAEGEPDSRFSWSDPDNWTDFDSAHRSKAWPKVADDLAFILQRPDEPYAAPADDVLFVDLDDVRDPITGEVIPQALAVLARLGRTYTEVSTSGGGLHAFYTGALPDGHRQLSWELDGDPAFEHDKPPAVEIYDGKRQAIVTGHHVVQSPSHTHDVDTDALSALAEEHGRKRREMPDDHEPRTPTRSRDEVADLETTTDWDDVLDAVAHLTFGDVPTSTDENHTSTRHDGTVDLDPAYRVSDSGTGATLAADGSVVYDRKHDVAMDPLDLLAVEEGIIGIGDELAGQDFLDALEVARVSGAPIPEFVSETDAARAELAAAADTVRENDAQAEADAVAGDDDDAAGQARELADDHSEEAAAIDDGDRPWPAVRQLFDDPEVPKREAAGALRNLLADAYEWAAMRDTGELYHYAPALGIYRPKGEQLVGDLLATNLPQHYSRHLREETAAYLRDTNWTDRDAFGGSESDPVVAVKNGVVDLSDGSFYDHSPDRMFVSRVEADYDPDATCPEFDAFLDDVVEKDKAKALVYELIGHAMHPGYPVAGFAMFTGDGANGKSTLLTWIENFLGPSSVSSESIHDLTTSRFSTSALYGKKANICAELDADELKSTGVLKNLTGGDSVRAEKKHEDTFTFHNEATLMFAANEPPETPDQTKAFWRRLLLVNFPNEFRPGDPDYEEERVLLARIQTEAEKSGVLNRAIEGAQKLRADGEFTTPIDRDEIARHYEMASDPVAKFVNDCLAEDHQAEEFYDDIYAVYVRWCDENDVTKKGDKVLPSELKKHINYDSARPRVGGSRKTRYDGITFTGRGDELLRELRSPDDGSEDGAPTGIHHYGDGGDR